MNLNDYLRANRRRDGIVKPVTCVDGFHISVQAHAYAYCSPRDDDGPYDQVECGFPSAPPEFIMDYCEDPDRPTATIYGYVPIALVEQLIAHHGGMAPA